MRQFLLAASAAYPSVLPLKAGEFAVTTLVNGVETISEDGAAVKDNFYLNLKKASGDTVVLPAYNMHFSFEKSVYTPGSVYTGDVTIADATSDGHYTLILFKKGLKFNERNRWSATVPVKTGDKGTDIAAKLVKYFQANANNLNIRAEVASNKLTITGINNGEDFTLKGADDLLGIAVTETAATAPFNDAAYIADLASKAAADAGYLHTYYDLDVNPGYPLNPLAQNDKADTGFTVFTLRFAVPRQVKTRDEVVHQIVQIAFPTGAGAIATVETILNAIASNSVAAE